MSAGLPVEIVDGELRSTAAAVSGDEVSTGGWAAGPPSDPIVSGRAGLWRVSRLGPRSIDVVKLLHHSAQGYPSWLTSDDPARWYYWHREALASQSDRVSSLEGGLGGADS